MKYIFINTVELVVVFLRNGVSCRQNINTASGTFHQFHVNLYGELSPDSFSTTSFIILLHVFKHNCSFTLFTVFAVMDLWVLFVVWWLFFLWQKLWLKVETLQKLNCNISSPNSSRKALKVTQYPTTDSKSGKLCWMSKNASGRLMRHQKQPCSIIFPILFFT